MFNLVTATWNPLVGCYFRCEYCWARYQAKRQRRRCLLCYHFIPHAHLDRLKRLPKRKFVFAFDMGDVYWYKQLYPKQLLAVLNEMALHKDNTYLLLTKSPSVFHDILESLAPLEENTFLGATIETNVSFIAQSVSCAPKPLQRYLALKGLKWRNKWLSIEPILDFTKSFFKWIENVYSSCEKLVVYVGYNQYPQFNKILEDMEPPPHKALELIDKIRQLGAVVHVKHVKKQEGEG